MNKLNIRLFVKNNLLWKCWSLVSEIFLIWSRYNILQLKSKIVYEPEYEPTVNEPELTGYLSGFYLWVLESRGHTDDAYGSGSSSVLLLTSYELLLVYWLFCALEFLSLNVNKFIIWCANEMKIKDKLLRFGMRKTI